MEELRWLKWLESLTPEETDRYFDELEARTSNDHRQFIKEVEGCLLACRKRLARVEKPPFHSPEWIKGYQPETWCSNRMEVAIDWLRGKTNPLISQVRQGFPEAIRHMVVAGNHQYQLWLIPRARYERSAEKKTHQGIAVPGTGVPCLHWWVEIYVMVSAEVCLRDGVVNLRYPTGVTKYIACSAEYLGKIYAQADFWQSQYIFYTPLVLLLSLARGGHEDKDVEVMVRDVGWTTYQIRNFPQPIAVNDDFAQFIKGMSAKEGLGKALLSRGIVDERSAILMHQQLEQLIKPEAKAAVIKDSPQPGTETGDGCQELVHALTGLGYSNKEAMSAAEYVFQKFPDETLENKIKSALQLLSK